MDANLKREKPADMLRVEAAYCEDEIVGLRITADNPAYPLLIWADNSFMKGFRVGKEFVANWGRKIEYRDVAIGEPEPAAPAAPQGVAYAELPTTESYLFQHVETGLTQFVDAQQVEWGFQQNNPRLRRIGGAYTADHMRDFADRTHALRASNGQAPAGATVRHLEAVIKDAADKLEAAMRCHQNAVETLTREALEILHGDPEPFTTAQAAPAPVLHLVHDAFAEVAMAFPEAYALHKVGIADTAVREALAAPAADPAYSEACSLANALFEKHYRQEPDYASGRVVWSLCDTTAGVISQIDNMVSGLARAPAAGAVAGMPPGISALMCVISSLRDTAHFSDEEGELTDELRTLRDWAMTQAAAPTPAAQANSQPAPQGETNVQLDIDSNPPTPGQHRDMAGSVALGQPMGYGQDQASGHPGAQGDKLLTVAERNIRSFLRSAVFKSESDREAALSCVDVLRDAARAPADSVPNAQFDDPKVQIVYAILCENAKPPEGEHWEGFAARRIVDALCKESVRDGQNH